MVKPNLVKYKPRRRKMVKYKRRGGRALPTTIIQRGLAPIAPRSLVRLRYSSTVSRNLSSGIPSDNLYRLNSIFDPDLTGVGTQPYGHDTYQGLYNRYRVYYVTWRVSGYTTATASQVNMVVVPNNSTTALNDHELAREMPRAINKLGGNVGSSPLHIKGTLSLPALNGQTKAQYMADDRFQSQFGTNPSEDLILHIVAQSPDNITFRANIDLVYYVELFDPIPLSKS